MRKQLRVGFAALAMIGFMVSCSTSNDVASNRKIQKRKYNKGFFIDFDKKFGKGASQNEEEIVTTNVVIDEKEVVMVEEVTAPVSMTAEAAKVEDKAVEVVNPVQEEVVVEEATVEYATSAPEVNTVSAEKIKFEKSTKANIKMIKPGLKFIKHKQKKAEMSKSNTSDDAILYYLLAIFIPFLAVGLVTDWDLRQVLINVLLCLLCGLPGIIHALIVVSRNV